MLDKFQRLLKNFIFQKTYIFLSLLFLALTGMMLLYLFSLSEKIVEQTALADARLFSRSIEKVRSLYTSEVVDTVKSHGIDIAHNYKQKEYSIPLPATFSMILGKSIGEDGSGAYTRLFSPYPFPWRREENLQIFKDSFSQKAWKSLNENPQKAFYSFENYKGKKSLRFATADSMETSCVNCHNSHPQSPKTNWKVGDTRGVLEVVLPLEIISQESSKTVQKIFPYAFLISIALIYALNKIVSHFRNSEKRAIALRNKAEATGKKLQKSNEELERFAYISSHDLKSPLRAISSLAQWIEEDSGDVLSENSRKNLDTLRGRVERMDNLIEDLLQFSRVGKEEYKPEIVDVEKLLKEIIDLLDIPEGFNISYQKNMPSFTTLLPPLKQIFMNLTNNAIKHHKNPSHGQVKISWQDKGSFYQFSVTDNGPGIAPEHHQKAFKMFHTLQSRDRVEGSGMGLAFIEKIIRNQGGNIVLESDVGKGATFHFTWPKQ